MPRSFSVAHLKCFPTTRTPHFTIINMAATPNIISVHPSFPAKDYNGFLEEIKKNPEKYAFASTGHGAITHLLMELFMSMTGTKMTHLAYKGAGPALNDVVGGQVPIILDNLPSSLPFIKTGPAGAIVVAAPDRLKQLPNVPTFKEVGIEPRRGAGGYISDTPRCEGEDQPRRVGGILTLRISRWRRREQPKRRERGCANSKVASC